MSKYLTNDIVFLFLSPRQILWENRLKNDIGLEAKASIDGVHFLTTESHPFWRGNYSHKFNGPGYTYEIALGIQSGDIVNVHGPFRAARPDSRLFESDLRARLFHGERCMGDYHYRKNLPEYFVQLPADNPELGRMSADVQARHETVNERIRNFNILSHRFRHSNKGDDYVRHSAAFRAVAVIVQLEIENGSPLFVTNYR